MITAIGYIVDNTKYLPFKFNNEYIDVNGMTLYNYFKNYTAQESKQNWLSMQLHEQLEYMNSNINLTGKLELISTNEIEECELIFYFNFDNNTISVVYSKYENPIFILNCNKEQERTNDDVANEVMNHLKLIESFFTLRNSMNDMYKIRNIGFIGLSVNNYIIGYSLADGHYSTIGLKILDVLEHIYQFYWACKAKTNLFADIFLEFNTICELTEDWYNHQYDHSIISSMKQSDIVNTGKLVLEYFSNKFDVKLQECIINPNLGDYDYSYIFNINNMTCSVYESPYHKTDYYNSLVLDEHTHFNYMRSTFKHYDNLKRDFICKLLYNNKNNVSNYDYILADYIDNEDMFWHLYNFYLVNFCTSDIKSIT